MIFTLLFGSIGLFAPTPAKAASVDEAYTWVRTSTTPLNAVAYGNGLYVGIQSGRIFTSSDLATWTQQDVSAATLKSLNTVKFLNGKFYAAATRDDSKTGASFIYSSDGITWNAGASSPVNAHTSYKFSSIAYGNNKYFATSSNNGGAVGSSTGMTWSNSSLGSGFLNDIIYAGNRFIVAGQNYTTGTGIVRQSADNTGTSWGAETAVTGSTSLNGLASNGSQVIAVGYNGKIFRTDSTTSSALPTVAVSSPVTANLSRVAYSSANDGLYAAVGDSNTIVTSKDGLVWTKEAATTAAGNFNDVIFGADSFVAVATDGVYTRNLAYTVSFDSNGGTAVASLTVVKNDKAGEPVAPTKTGYSFEGWYTDSGTTIPFNFATTAIASDIKLYAKWTALSYNVSFNSNGGSTVTNQTVSYSGYAAEPEAPTRTGYAFAGWYANAGLTNAFNFTTMAITNHTTIYAKWTLLPLAAPANVTATAGEEQATITWNAVEGATYYEVYQGTVSSEYSDTPIATVSESTYHYSASNLTNGTTYYFAIKAGNTVTISTYSNEVEVTPEAIVLPALAVVSISSDNSHSALAKAGDTVTVTFTANKELDGLPNVTIAGQAADVTLIGNSEYKATYTLSGSEAAGAVSFTIDFTDTEGYVGDTVTATTDGSSVTVDNTAPSGSLLINDGAASTSSSAVTLTMTSDDGSGSGNIQMRLSNDNVNWDSWEAAAATKAWTLTSGSGTKTVYMQLKDEAGNVTTLSAAIRLQAASTSTSGSSSQDETITVNVENSGSANKTVVSTVTIIRKTDASGQKKDSVTLTAEQAAQTVDQLKALGSSSASILIPDTKDEVSELNLTLSQASTALFTKNSVALELVTNHVRMNIPGNSLQQLQNDIYFRVVPVKDEKGRKEIEQRAIAEQAAQLATGSKSAVVIGRPVTIETNLQNRPVTLVLPLGTLTNQQLDDLGVFIEHSDGTKEFVHGEIVTYDESGQLGIRFSINKFSTFTIVYMEDWNTDNTAHKAFVTGYANGLFKPDASITRAEIAAIAARVIGTGATSSTVSFTDVSAAHWAKEEIGQGFMQGYPDGSFKPEKTITRAEMAALVARLKGDTEAGSSAASFSDVAGHWAQKAIEAAKAAGIINGYSDGTFRPEAELTRAEAVTIISKLLGRGPLSGAAPKWKDVPATHWAFGYIQEASIDHAVGTKTDDGEQLIES